MYSAISSTDARRPIGMDCATRVSSAARRHPHLEAMVEGGIDKTRTQAIAADIVGGIADVRPPNWRKFDFSSFSECAGFVAQMR